MMWHNHHRIFRCPKWFLSEKLEVCRPHINLYRLHAIVYMWSSWLCNCRILLLLFMFISMEWDYVSEMWPPTGLLFIPRWYMSIKAMAEWYWQGETKELKRIPCLSTTLSITNPTWIDPGVNLGLRGDRPATNGLSHGTAHYYCQ
jgi:hypothetical protein